MVFVATGSASLDFYGGNRVGDNLYANSVIALDARTGKHVWHYQVLRHDLWDRDLPAAPVLVTVKRGGQHDRRRRADHQDRPRVRVRPRDAARRSFPIE